MFFEKIVHPEDREAARVGVSADEAGQPFQREYRIIRPDGAVRWIRGRGFPVRSTTGELSHYAGVALDITDRKLAEERIKNTEEKLRALSARIQGVREEERAYIAREIHDDLGQRLTGLKLEAAWFFRHLNPDQSELKEKAKELQETLDQTIKTVRRISTELRPRLLDDFGLIAALEWQSREFSEKTDISIRFQSIVPDLDLKEDISIAVFRIFQEALTNVVRHSGATCVEASLDTDSEGLVFMVRDNGRGISEEEIARTRSLGLVSMRERAMIFGGTFDIKGKKGQGTVLTLRVPIT